LHETDSIVMRAPAGAVIRASGPHTQLGREILEAAEEFDAGAIWASHEFALENNPPAKSSLYRGQVTEAALRGILEAVARIESREFQTASWRPEKLTDVSP
jgi:putative two-component system protein, hydrogenase maturation factor HypX/HoxX